MSLNGMCFIDHLFIQKEKDHLELTLYTFVLAESAMVKSVDFHVHVLRI